MPIILLVLLVGCSGNQNLVGKAYLSGDLSPQTDSVDGDLSCGNLVCESQTYELIEGGNITWGNITIFLEYAFVDGEYTGIAINSTENNLYVFFLPEYCVVWSVSVRLVDG